MRVMDKDRPAPARSDPGGPEATGAPRRTKDSAPGPDVADTQVAFLDGRILIAMPGIGDPRFERSVLLLCVHNEQQAMGLVLNRPMNGLTVPGLLRRLNLGADNVPDAPVLYGGPVERARGYVLHTDDYASAGSTLPVAEGLALTDTREVLDALSDEDRRPRRSILALGYAGWGAGQLERELQEGVWLACEPDETLVFGRDHETKWTHALSKIGVTADRLSVQGGRA